MKNILIATDIDFFKFMKGNSNRILSYYKFLKKYFNVDIFFLNDESCFNSSNIYCYNNYLSEDEKELSIKEQRKISFKNFVSKREYDFIIIPYIWNDYLIKDLNLNAKTICDTHDSISERTKSFKEYGVSYRNPYSVEEERNALNNFDYIMAITPEERELFQSMGLGNIFIASYFYEKPKVNKNKLGFIGSNALHNYEAIKWFYKNVFKGNLDNEYYLYIGGDIARCPQTRRMLLNQKNVVLYSPIWNIEDFYNIIDIAINPIQFGSGLKIKNIEAISFEKPVITSNIGLQGMGVEKKYGAILEANNKYEWFDKIKYVVNNYEKITNLLWHYNNSVNTENRIYHELNSIIKGRSVR